MTRRIDSVRRLIDECTQDERTTILKYLRTQTPLHPLEAEWNTRAESLLTAIARSSDLTKRGIRGILAEATFEDIVIPKIGAEGWVNSPVEGHHPYDFFLAKGNLKVRVQVKLQRREVGRPKEYPRKRWAKLVHAPEELFCVEVQRTRSGQHEGESTRPYRFGDFDILAVNLHPSTNDWQRFVYTVEPWLLPRQANRRLIEIFQPVSSMPDRYWTDSFSTCVRWLRSGRRRKLYMS